jgi:hypothetical protein
MIKRIAASLCIVLVAACASTPMTSSASGGSSGFGQKVRLSNAPHYIQLSAPNQVGEWDFSGTPPRGLYIRGTLTDQGFAAAGPVQGNGKFCADGKDWFSLTGSRSTGPVRKLRKARS